MTRQEASQPDYVKCIQQRHQVRPGFAASYRPSLIKCATLSGKVIQVDSLPTNMRLAGRLKPSLLVYEKEEDTTKKRETSILSKSDISLNSGTANEIMPLETTSNYKSCTVSSPINSIECATNDKKTVRLDILPKDMIHLALTIGDNLKLYTSTRMEHKKPSSHNYNSCHLFFKNSYYCSDVSVSADPCPNDLVCIKCITNNNPTKLVKVDALPNTMQLAEQIITGACSFENVYKECN